VTLQPPESEALNGFQFADALVFSISRLGYASARIKASLLRVYTEVFQSSGKLLGKLLPQAEHYPRS